MFGKRAGCLNCYYFAFIQNVILLLIILKKIIVLLSSDPALPVFGPYVMFAICGAMSLVCSYLILFCFFIFVVVRLSRFFLDCVFFF